jgi:transposase
VLEVLKALLTQGGTAEAVAAQVVVLVAQLVLRNSDLERRLSKLLSRPRKNEGISSAQLKLFLSELAEASEASLAAADKKLRAASGIDEDKPKEPMTEAPPRAPRLRRPIPERLRRIDNPLPVPKEERPCAVCGKERRCMGHDVTEVIELIPAEVVVRRDIREKLVCDDCEGEVSRGPTGDKVVEGGRLGSGLVSELVVDKYRDGLPLHRQKQRLERLGLSLPVSTLADQVTWATDLLRPLWRHALGRVLNAEVMHLDGTGLPVLDKSCPGNKKLGALWGFVGDEVALYLYASTGRKVGQRDGELGPEDVLKRRRGYTVADASTLFDSSFARSELIECGCNMHARRYFRKALDRGDSRAALPLSAFKKLYEIEAEIRDRDAECKKAERQRRSKPVYEELMAWCQAHRPYEPPKSALGEALRYVHNHREALQRFLHDGVIPIDNGIVERLHVRAALTRKNFLFAGSDAGGERAAIAYTILGCCSLAQVNPAAYLKDVLPKLARRVRVCDLPELMPDRWKRSQAAPPPAEPNPS